MSTPTPRIDPAVWLLPVGIALLLVAGTFAAVQRNLGPGFVLCGLAALPALGFGIGALMDQTERRHPHEFHTALWLLMWVSTIWVGFRIVRRVVEPARDETSPLK